MRAWQPWEAIPRPTCSSSAPAAGAANAVGAARQVADVQAAVVSTKVKRVGLVKVRIRQIKNLPHWVLQTIN